MSQHQNIVCLFVQHIHSIAWFIGSANTQAGERPIQSWSKFLKVIAIVATEYYVWQFKFFHSKNVNILAKE